jgi:DNA-binding HxlR family transcriptional regulator
MQVFRGSGRSVAAALPQVPAVFQPPTATVRTITTMTDDSAAIDETLEPEATSQALDRTSREALADALATVGDRWTLLVIAALLDGPKRFGDLQTEVPGIAPNVLTQRLRQLERNALIIARPYSERPPRFVYELSAAGQELAGALRLLAGWGARNAEGGTGPRHSVCGTPMEARWWCPTCERTVADEEDEELHFA